MPRNQFQRMVFAFITVVITVHVFVFYNLYFIPLVEQGQPFSSAMVIGMRCPIWGVILLEFVFAYTLEVLMGSPCSFKLASRVFDPRKNHPMLFESAIICATVGLMCPAMSLIATFLYFDYSHFSIGSLCATYLCTVMKNFPLAFFSQLFFIQPLVRTIFKVLFRKDIEERTAMVDEHVTSEGVGIKPQSETEAIEDIIKRQNEIRKETEKEEE